MRIKIFVIFLQVFNPYKNSDKVPFIIYADLQCSREKIDGFKNNPENSSSTKVDEHIPSGFSMSTVSSKSKENKHDVYQCKDCMKKFCESLREHAIEIIKFIYLYICKGNFGDKHTKDENYCKVRNHCYYIWG